MQSNLLRAQIDLSNKHLWCSDVTEITVEEIEKEDEEWNIIKIEAEDSTQEVSQKGANSTEVELRKKEEMLRAEIMTHAEVVYRKINLWTSLEFIDNEIESFE